MILGRVEDIGSDDQICFEYSLYEFEPAGILKMPNLFNSRRSDRSDCGWVEGSTSFPGDLMESLSAESDSEATGFCKKGGVGGHMSSPFPSRKVRMSLTRFYTCRFSMALNKLHPEQNSLDLAEVSKHDPENSGIWWVKYFSIQICTSYVCIHTDSAFPRQSKNSVDGRACLG